MSIKIWLKVTCFAFALSLGAIPSFAKDSVIARVNGVEIYRSDYERFLKNLLSKEKDQNETVLFSRILPKLIEHEVLLQAARKAGVDQEPGFKGELKRAKEKLEVEYYVKTLSQRKILSEKKLREKYKHIVDQWPHQEEIKARIILVKKEETAKNIVKKLNGGADFSALAEQYSEDISASRGGDIGYFTEQRVRGGPLVAKHIFSIPKGQHNKTPFKSPFGWQIVKVEDRRPSQPPSYEEMLPLLTEKAGQTAGEQTIGSLLKSAHIEAYDLQGRAIQVKK